MATSARRRSSTRPSPCVRARARPDARADVGQQTLERERLVEAREDALGGAAAHRPSRPRPAPATTNSSPPRRATTARRPARPPADAASWRRSSSPTWWPSVSLISLKRSMSTSSRPTGSPPAAAARESRLEPPGAKSRRLPRPVSSSVRACSRESASSASAARSRRRRKRGEDHEQQHVERDARGSRTRAVRSRIVSLRALEGADLAELGERVIGPGGVDEAAEARPGPGRRARR